MALDQTKENRSHHGLVVLTRTWAYDPCLWCSTVVEWKACGPFLGYVFFFCCTWRGFQSMVLERRDIKRLINDLWTRDATKSAKRNRKDSGGGFFLQTDTYILILKSDIWPVSFFSFKYMKIPPPVSAPIRWLLCLLHSKCVLLTLDRVLFWTNRAVLTVVR